MLGRKLHDPNGIEGAPEAIEGLGLLDVETTLHDAKHLNLVSARHIASGEDVAGYEMHLGETTGPDCDRPAMDIDGRLEGATDKTGRVCGTYLHGIFAMDEFRRAFLGELGASTDENASYEASVDETLDLLASHLETYLDIDMLVGIAGV